MAGKATSGSRRLPAAQHCSAAPARSYSRKGVRSPLHTPDTAASYTAQEAQPHDASPPASCVAAADVRVRLRVRTHTQPHAQRHTRSTSACVCIAERARCRRAQCSHPPRSWTFAVLTNHFFSSTVYAQELGTCSPRKLRFCAAGAALNRLQPTTALRMPGTSERAAWKQARRVLCQAGSHGTRPCACCCPQPHSFCVPPHKPSALSGSGSWLVLCSALCPSKRGAGVRTFACKLSDLVTCTCMGRLPSLASG